MLDYMQSATGKTIKIFGVCRIGNVVRIKSLTFISDTTIKTFAIDFVVNTDGFRNIVLVAVFHCINDRFIQSQLDGANFFIVESMPAEASFNIVYDPRAFRRIGSDHIFSLYDRFVPGRKRLLRHINMLVSAAENAKNDGFDVSASRSHIFISH